MPPAPRALQPRRRHAHPCALAQLAQPEAHEREQLGLERLGGGEQRRALRAHLPRQLVTCVLRREHHLAALAHGHCREDVRQRPERELVAHLHLERGLEVGRAARAIPLQPDHVHQP